MVDDSGTPDAEIIVEGAEADGREKDFFDHEPSKQEKHEVGSHRNSPLSIGVFHC
jgi:hypothetical protein